MQKPLSQLVFYLEMEDLVLVRLRQLKPHLQELEIRFKSSKVTWLGFFDVTQAEVKYVQSKVTAGALQPPSKLLQLETNTWKHLQQALLQLLHVPHL
jgi:hypothetical protein